MKAVQIAKPPWTDLVLVCRKCVRKAGARSFRKELKGALRRAGFGARVRLAETSCLDLCPKRRIVLALGSDLAARRILVASPNGADAVAALLTSLSPEPQTGIDRGGGGT